MITAIFFYIFAATTVVFALGVVSFRNPIYSALSLIGCLLTVAAIFAIQSAQLLFALQIIVYAGGIMMLIIFVIMLLNLDPHELGIGSVNARKVFGLYLMGVTGILLLVRLSTHLWPANAKVDNDFGSVKEVGRVLYTEYLLPFEMISLLLLAAIIGAVVLTRKPKGDGS